MGKLSNQGVKVPFRHVSIRVPWHDTDWTGCVCKNPKNNASCLVLQRIRELRKDDLEEVNAGKSFYDLSPDQYPSCIDEHINFMSPKGFTKALTHPFKNYSPLHKHILPTDFYQPPFSVRAVPFRWTLKNNADVFIKQYGVDVNIEREPNEIEWLKNNSWKIGRAHV